jgi:hypothetical protein
VPDDPVDPLEPLVEPLSVEVPLDSPPLVDAGGLLLLPLSLDDFFA